MVATPAAVNKTPDPRVQPEVEIAEDVFWAGRGERPHAGVVVLIPVNSQVASVSVPWAEPRKWNPKVNRVTNNMENLRLAKG